MGYIDVVATLASDKGPEGPRDTEGCDTCALAHRAIREWGVAWGGRKAFSDAARPVKQAACCGGLASHWMSGQQIKLQQVRHASLVQSLRNCGYTIISSARLAGIDVICLSISPWVLLWEALRCCEH